MRGCVGEHWAGEDRAEHPLGGEATELELVAGARRQTHRHCPLCAGRIHHGQAVARELDGPVATGIGRTIGVPVADAVHRQYPEVACQIGNLHLPVARMEHRPGWQQEDRVLALAVDLVEQSLPVPLDETF